MLVSKHVVIYGAERQRLNFVGNLLHYLKQDLLVDVVGETMVQLLP